MVSYAAVCEIVLTMQEQAKRDWSTYSLLASIEEARLADGNPPVPSELRQDYENACAAMRPMALRDLAEAQDDMSSGGALAVVHHAKGQRTLGTIALFTEDERVEMLGG